MPVEVDVQTDHSFTAKLEKLLAVQDLTKFADKVAPVVLNVLRAEAPKKTGEMASRLHYKRVSGVDAAGVFTKLEFAGPHDPLEWVLHGTMPHVIEPRKKDKLGRWQYPLHWVDTDGHHFAYHVDHPGIVNPSDFPRRAWRTVKPLVGEIFRASFS